jgi:hypothetical protein
MTWGTRAGAGKAWFSPPEKTPLTVSKPAITGAAAVSELSNTTVRDTNWDRTRTPQ